MKPDDLDMQVWLDWLQIRKDKRAPRLTATVLKTIAREAAKLGWSLSEAIEYAAEHEWRGFKSAWVKPDGEGFIEKHTDTSWARSMSQAGRYTPH